MDDAQVEAIILGSGTSHGVPMIGCRCAVCTSDDPRDKRTRASIFVRLGAVRILVDTSPELRLQCVSNDVHAINAVLFTHHHADHVLGIDDLRRFNWLMKSHLDCYANARTLERLRSMFAYAFDPAPDSPHSRPALALHEITGDPLHIAGEVVTPIPLMHGPLPILGFRFGNFAYCTDCNAIPEPSRPLLQGLDVLVLDALRKTPHPTHFNIEQAVAAATVIDAKRTYFTHVAHELMHEPTNAELPDRIKLAYDGLRIQATA